MIIKEIHTGPHLSDTARHLLVLRENIFPLEWLLQFSREFLNSVLAAAMGEEIARSEEASEKERFEQARAIFGIGPKASLAYIFGPEFALDDGGLALVRRVFGDSLAVVIVRNAKEEAFVAAENQKLAEKNRPPILVARDLQEAQDKLRDSVRRLGSEGPGAYAPWGIAKSTEPLAESLKQILRENMTLVTQDLFRRFAETSGLESLVGQLKSQFLIARSA